MKSFEQLRNEIQEKMSKKDMKKLGVEDPLSGKGYPYQERTSPLPKATGFALTYPMKDNKQVTKLTKLGGKVDRVNKRVVFNFNTVAARTKFRKKNKELLSTITESVEMDELRMSKWPKGDPRAGQLVHKSPKIKYAKIVKGIRDAQGPFSVVAIKNGKVVAQKNSIKNSKMLPIEVNDMADAHPGATISIESKSGEILNTFKESVELDEALVLASDNRRDVEKTAKKLAKQSPDRTYYVVRNLETYMDRYEVVDSVDMHMYKKSKKVVGYGKNVKESVDELDEGTPAYRKAMAAYKNSDTKKVFDILKKKGFRAYAQSDTLVRNMLKKNKGNVQKAAAEIEKKYPGHFKESVELDEKSFRDFDVSPSPETKKYIESGKAKILKKVPSVLGPTTKFVVIERPKMSMGSGKQDKVIMATISDPKRGRIKMFAFHGSHINIAKAMQFAINNKLVTTTKMESVELDEDEGKKTLRVQSGIGKSKHAVSFHDGKKKHKDGSPFHDIKIFKNKKDSEAFVQQLVKKGYRTESVELDEKILSPMYFDSGMSNRAHADRFVKFIKSKKITIQSYRISGQYEIFPKTPQDVDTIRKAAKKYGLIAIKESVELDEADNTAAVAKQVKQAVKKYTTGKLAVQSKGGKTRFIMLRADKIDNKLRKMILVAQGIPLSNVKNQNDIHYGNISDRIISAGVEVWTRALGLKESVELDEYLRKDVYAIADKKGKVVAANLIKKNAHKEISRHRNGTIVLDPDAKTGDVLKTFAKESVELDESHMIGRTVIVAGMKGKVTKQIGKDGETESDEIYRVRFEDGSVKDIPARDMEIQNDKPSENEAKDIVNVESVARRSRILNYFKKK